MSRATATSVQRTLRRNLSILAVLSVALLALLAIAPAKAYFSEWRGIQKQYNARAAKAGLSTIKPALAQIWRPEVKLTDRCTTCHLGMGGAAALPKGKALFGAHPNVHHEVASMGCTICHRGQGRATSKKAAHGQSKHWEDPMLPKAHLQASCGQCHAAAAKVPPLSLARKGEYLFDMHGCKSCHVVDGKGGKVGPDLSGVALKGYDRKWHVRHLRDPQGTVAGSKMMSFGHLTDGEVNAIMAYVETLIGAPKLMRGKAVAVEQGCRGCHKIGGVGGDNAPDLSNIAAKTAVDLDFTHVKGPKTIVAWHKEHLRRPSDVYPGSKMPVYRLPPGDEDSLITYLLSLRAPQVPLKLLPRKTRAANLQVTRDIPTDGASLFRAFCSACHGSKGEGQVMKALDTTVPAVGNPDMLSMVSDAFLRQTIRDGRPGREMPSWGGREGGLKDSEITELIRYLRRNQKSAPGVDKVKVAMATADKKLGRTVFKADCAGCHGLDGTGTVIAPSVVNKELLFAVSAGADDKVSSYLYDTITRGRANTAMPAHRGYDAQTLAGMIAWLRGHDGPAATKAAQRKVMAAKVSSVLGTTKLMEYRASGNSAYGRHLFRGMCEGCHGPAGQGGVGPSISNRAFLNAASDGFLASSIILGRGGRPMRPFGPDGIARLTGREVGDIITFLRLEGSRRAAVPPSRKVRGNEKRGASSFAQLCAGCHGVKGKGKTAPALANKKFLEIASDGFLQATIARGRRGTAMRSWAFGGFGFAELAPQEINDIVAYIRSWRPRRADVSASAVIKTKKSN